MNKGLIKVPFAKNKESFSRTYRIFEVQTYQYEEDEMLNSEKYLMKENMHEFNFEVKVDIILMNTDSIQSVVFSSDGLLLASGSADKSIKIWNFQKNHTEVTFNGHTESVNSVVFSPDGLFLASGCEEKRQSLGFGGEEENIYF